MSTTAPERYDAIMSIADVVRRTSLSIATIYRRVEAGTFPRKVPLGGRRVGWYESEVAAFVANPVTYRVSEPAGGAGPARP